MMKNVSVKENTNKTEIQGTAWEAMWVEQSKVGSVESN